MARSIPKATTDAVAVAPKPAEHWTIIQVASFLSIPYQSARNQMLEGRFGESQYDATSRKLTVLASLVQSAKSVRGRPKKRSRKRA